MRYGAMQLRSKNLSFKTKNRTYYMAGMIRLISQMDDTPLPLQPVAGWLHISKQLRGCKAAYANIQ
jgi:hypothetical protein